MTRRDEIERDLVEICSAVLEHPVDATASRATDAAWDSLRHMQVIFAVEEKYDNSFTEEEIFRLDSIGKLADHLEQRLPAE